MTKVKWPDIEKRLDYLDKPELIEVLRDLFQSSKTNRAFLAIRFLDQGDGGEALEEYRKRIVDQVYPKRGFGKLNLGDARRSIREYHKTTSDLAGTIDLLLTYVEKGTDFTNDFGDINEGFYDSLESALGEMANLLKTPEGIDLYPRFQKRIAALSKKAYGIGWGYGDAVADQVEDLEAYMGEQWEGKSQT